MFEFLRRSNPRPLSDAIRVAIEKDGTGPAAGSLGQLRMVEMNGRYSDRKVTYFRVFDPASAAQRTLDIRRYKDFDVFPALVMRSGHVERDGAVILTRAVTVRAIDSAVRTRAGRAVPNHDTSAGDSAIITAIRPAAAEMPAAGPTVQA